MVKWKYLRIKKLWFILFVLMLSTVLAGLAFDAYAPYMTNHSVLKIEMHPRAEPIDDVELLIPFAIDSLCRITDENNSMNAFLDELGMLLAGKDTVIQIVHLGDSHVQAGFYTGQVMRLLHHAFGNAGRGWIAPLKLAKINEPKDYYITSSKVKEWIAGRCIQLSPKCIWGLGGLGIQTDSKTVDFEVSITPNNGAGYEFNRALLYRDDKAIPLLPTAEGSIAVQTVWGTETGLPRIAVDTFLMDDKAMSLHLLSVPSNDLPPDFDLNMLQTPNCYYGFSLMNGNAGILYHAIGQNGAMFRHYTNSDYFRQLALLSPSLIIITLGTNEAFSIRNLTDAMFASQLDRFIQLVKEYLPTTAILLTTPAENFRRTSKGYVRNENISLIANVITEYAQREGLACFDLYGMTGGVNSCQKWQEAKYFGRDRIHYTVEGYYEQGKMLYKALIRKITNYETAFGGSQLRIMGEAGETEEAER